MPLAFTSVLETGFAGGHGTAVAMNQSFIDNGLPNVQVTVDATFVEGITNVEMGVICRWQDVDNFFAPNLALHPPLLQYIFSFIKKSP